MGTAEFEDMVEVRGKEAVQIAPTKVGEVDAGATDREVRERDMSVDGGTRGLHRVGRFESEPATADPSVKIDRPGLPTRGINHKRKILGFEDLDVRLELLRLLGDREITEPDLTVLETQTLDQHLPGRALFLGFGGRRSGRRQRAWDHEAAVARAVEAHREGIELDLLNGQRLAHETQPTDFDPESRHRKDWSALGNSDLGLGFGLFERARFMTGWKGRGAL